MYLKMRLMLPVKDNVCVDLFGCLTDAWYVLTPAACAAEHGKNTNDWVGTDGVSIGSLDVDQITAKKLYDEYSSRSKDVSVSSSRVLKYLPKGTSFDNLLACDAVNLKNRST